MSDEPENYLDTSRNPTFVGIREMQTTLEDMGKYCLLVRRGNDLTLPRELRRQAYEEAKRHTRFAMYGSTAGLGKTWLGKRILKKAGLRVPSHELNPNNPASLSYELWNLKRKGYEVAPIDDADRLMRSDPMIGLMKHGWNGDDPQINCFVTERIRKNEEYRAEGNERYNPSVPPPSFEYRLATPWFANKNLSTPGGLAQHTHPDFTALIDRGLRPRWINSEPRNVFFYTLWMMERGGLLREYALNLSESQDTLDAFVDAALRLQHPNPNLRLATDLAKVRKAADYKVLWTRIINESLATAAGLPRAIDKNDLKVRPDMQRAVEEARKEAERRKEAAARAVAEAKAAAERAKAERAKEEREVAETARREAEGIAAAFETKHAIASFPEVPEVVPPDAVRGAAAAQKVMPQEIFQPYTGASFMPAPMPPAAPREQFGPPELYGPPPPVGHGPTDKPAQSNAEKQRRRQTAKKNGTEEKDEQAKGVERPAIIQSIAATTDPSPVAPLTVSVVSANTAITPAADMPRAEPGTAMPVIPQPEALLQIQPSLFPPGAVGGGIDPIVPVFERRRRPVPPSDIPDVVTAPPKVAAPRKTEK